jgi:glycosyltransferase involved in cell wall biosynthesis
MRPIAYVTTAFPTQTFFLENEVHRLLAHGVDVRVYRLRGPGRNVQPEHRSLERITVSVGSPLDPRAWLDLLVWLVRKPHVLVPEVSRVLWASRSSLYAMIGHLGYLPATARIATRVEREGIGRLHAGWAHFPGTVAYLASRLTGARFSMTAHAGSDLYRTQCFLAPKVRAADFVTACVRGNADMLRRMGGPGARVEWLYHGVDRTRFDGSGRARDPGPLLLTVGRLHEGKGYDVALRVLAAVRTAGHDARLVVVGEGPAGPGLRRLAAGLGVAAHAEFRGALAQRDIMPLYRRAWLLLAPSRVLANGRRDGIPNVIVEAMAMGLPCAGTRAAGLEEAITDGVTGTLTPPDDVEAMTAAVLPLLADPTRIDRMGERARNAVRDDFDVERNFRRLLELFQTDGATLAVPPAESPATGTDPGATR